MIVELGHVEDSSLDFEFQLAPDEIDLEGENIRLTSSVTARGQLTKQIAQADVKGTISGTAEIDCTRCLKPIERELEIPFDVSFISEEEYANVEEHEVPPSDLSTGVFDGERVDLKELVREQIVLEIPEQVFCTEDCKGLCPNCGADRNLVDCKCEDQEIDPRWAALKNINRG